MKDPIVVPELSVGVVTGSPADDPYGQGFSAIYAEIVTADPTLLRVFSTAKHSRESVVVRCAMLDVIGPITKETRERFRRRTKFVLSVEDVVYRKPEQFWEKTSANRRAV